MKYSKSLVKFSCFLFLILSIVLPACANKKSKEKNSAVLYESGGETFKIEFFTELNNEQNDVIWGFDFLGPDELIFTEREGQLKTFNLKTKTTSIVSGAPKVKPSGQGGLLDVRVHPKDSTKIFLSYTEEQASGKMTTALGFGKLLNKQISDFKNIFRAHEPSSKSIHFGSRIEFDGNGHLWLSVGDRNTREHSQNLAYHTGKILRFKEDGSVPQDNPHVKNPNAKPEIWSLGHRNPQGLVFDSAHQQLWSTEMGPKGGDELNLILPSLNYGWPVVTYGREYSGFKIGEGPTKAGMENPKAYWVPSISPSALTIYTGHVFPKWKGQIFIGTLSGAHIRRIKLDNQDSKSPKIAEQDELIKDQFLRIRNVRTGPDGFLYFSTDDGKIGRVTK